jgi:hypothetical protein
VFSRMAHAEEEERLALAALLGLSATEEKRGADHADRDESSDAMAAWSLAEGEESGEKRDGPESEIRQKIRHTASWWRDTN